MIGRDPNRPFPVAIGRPLVASAIDIANRRGHRQASVRWWSCYDLAIKELEHAHRLGQRAALEHIEGLLAAAPAGRIYTRDEAMRLHELVDRLRDEVARRRTDPLPVEPQALPIATPVDEGLIIPSWATKAA
jgi:hypothetical protein